MVKIKSGQIKIGYLIMDCQDVKSGQNEKWSKWKVVKIKSGQN